MGITEPQTPEQLEQSLADRRWPERSNRTEFLKAERDPHVGRGRVFNRELRMYMGVSEPLPPGESAIRALATADNGQVYGVTGGRRAHLFYYSTHPHGDAVGECPLPDGILAPANRLVPLGRDLYGAAREFDDTLPGGPVFVHDTRPDYFRPYHQVHGRTETLATPVAGEGVATLAAAGGGRWLVGLSTDSATLWRCELPDGKVETIGLPGGAARPCPVLVEARDDGVFGVCADGRLLCIDAGTLRAEVLDTRLPGGKGASCAAHDPETDRLWFGVLPDGLLVGFDPASGELLDMGAAPPAPPIRTMTVGRDGHVYGVAGERDGLAEMFEADPAARTIEKLGILFAASERYWHGYEFDASCTGPQGELYFGESDRISHLFMVFLPAAGRCRS